MPHRFPLAALFAAALVMLVTATACAPQLAIRAARGLSERSERMHADLFNDGAVDLDIRFAPGKAEILPESKPLLDDAADALAEIDRDKYVLHVIGHTDSTGDAAMNMALSQKRAQAVVAYLQTRHELPWWFLTPKGKGETELKINPETSAADRAANRRVELVLVAKEAD